LDEFGGGGGGGGGGMARVLGWEDICKPYQKEFSGGGGLGFDELLG